MALNLVKFGFFLSLLAATAHMALGGDPDITSDFILPPNTNIVDSSFFTLTTMRALVGADPPTTFKVTKASMVEFPALNGQSVSYAMLQYPGDGVNPPHTHPRAAELLFLIDGNLEVGFVDTTGKLYTQTLQTGDMFIFPKGLVHFQYNANAQNPALAISAFGVQMQELCQFPGAVFTTGIEDDILAKSFKTDVATIQKIKAGLAPKA